MHTLIQHFREPRRKSSMYRAEYHSFAERLLIANSFIQAVDRTGTVGTRGWLLVLPSREGGLDSGYVESSGMWLALSVTVTVKHAV